MNRSSYFNETKLLQNYSISLPADFPTLSSDFIRRVINQQVALENIFIRGSRIYGTIRVFNRSFEKHVLIKFTLDQWKSCFNLNAHYSRHYSDSNTDSFQFVFDILHEESIDLLSLRSSTNIFFSICYLVAGEEFWDNNRTRNYSLDIIKKTYDDVNCVSNIESIKYDENLYEQIAQEYHAISNKSINMTNLCGLRNLGGTCYMNSVLRSLSLSSLLTNYFLSNNCVIEDMTIKHTSISKRILVNEYFYLLHLIFSGEYTVLSPEPFKQIIGHINNFYLTDYQQDAHEFLLFLLDYLHDGCVHISDSCTNKINDQSIIHELFLGEYQSTTMCMSCQYISHTYEPFISLSVPIPTDTICNLEDCLQYFNIDEDLTSDSKLFCTKCNLLQDGKRNVKIHKLPKILVVRLERFHMNSEGQYVKNNIIINYPIDSFSLNQYTTSINSQISAYTLYSVINHSGLLNDGHYTTYSRDILLNEDQWFECDDDIIKYLNPKRLYSNENAYLLFYTIK